MTSNQISVVRVEPNMVPEVVKIENTLRGFQEQVKGRIETFPYGNLLGICNESGKMNDMHVNPWIRIPGDTVFGPVIITKADGEEFASLSDQEADRVITLLYGRL